MTFDRKRTIRVLAGLAGAAALVASVTATQPSSADPKITDVQARVSTLYHQAEIASERLNQAREDLARGQTTLRALQSDVAAKGKQVAAIRRQVVAAVLAQSQGQSLSPATQVALANGADGFLQQLVIMKQYNDQQQERQATFVTQARELQLRQQSAGRELARLARTKRDLATQKASIETKAAQAQSLLRRLKATAAAQAADRVAQASRSLDQARTPLPAAPAVSTASGRAGAAVSYALAHVGGSYVWGASGPSSFDCSGLTMMAWQQAGVSLPHSAAAQMSYGTPVSSSQLQPGDLVFYYSPVSHVGIYIGHGTIVNAENPSVGVVEAPVFSMPYSGAVRPG